MSDLHVVIGLPATTRLTQISLLRDYTALSVVISAGLTVPLVYLNCRYMNALIGDLVRQSTHGLSRTTMVGLQANIRRLDADFAKTGRRSIWLFLVSLGAAGLLYGSLVTGDSYRRLIQAGGGRVLWWASFEGGHYVSGTVWLLVCAACIYIYLKNNIIGYNFLGFFLRTRSLKWYGMDELNQDGYYGWLALRRLLLSTYAAIVISVIAALLYLQNADSRVVLLGFPVLLLLAASIPALAITPLVLLRRVTARYREDRGLRVRERFEQAARHGSADSARLAAAVFKFRIEMTAVRDVNPRLFKPLTLAVALALYFAPVASFVLTLVSTLHLAP